MRIIIFLLFFYNIGCGGNVFIPSHDYVTGTSSKKTWRRKNKLRWYHQIGTSARIGGRTYENICRW